MAAKVVVLYASRHGATAQIAEKIALQLGKSGVVAQAQPVNNEVNLAEYQAVVLGSGVYAGMWLKDAVDFLKSRETELAKMPVWLFSDGPTGKGEPQELMKGWFFPEDLKPVAERIHPRGIEFFHGVIDMNTLKFAEKLIVKALKAPVGDFRDWVRINAWADKIAKALK